MMKYAEIDFEFTGISEKVMDVVCCSIRLTDTNKIFEFWLHNDDKEKRKLSKFLTSISNEYTLIAHQVSAEASALISIGIDPLQFKWVDTFIEFRMLTNHYNKLKYGKHYIKGKEVNLRPKPPKWVKDDRKDKATLNHSLSEAVYKFLDKKIDTDHKEEVRQIIISGDKEVIEKNKKVIQDYCTSDIIYLKPMFDEMLKYYKKLIPKHLKKGFRDELLWRGECSVRTAIMERTGYPVDYIAIRNFAASVPNILKDIQRDINNQFPRIHPFHIDKKTRMFVRKEKPIKEWIASGKYKDDWRLTKTKQYSLSVEAFEDHFPYRHEFPRGNFGAQMLRLLKTKQHMNGFMPTKEGTKKKTFWDFMGKDQIVRPYLNAYGSQSARFQPSATGFMFLKAAWMRALVQPPKGKMIVGIDYTSQEFLISALLSGDKAMLRSYFAEGGPYLNFGKEAGIIPPDGTKATHPAERQACKSTILGLSYSMTEFGLAKKLTADTGREWTEDEAREWVDLFNETYYELAAFKQELLENYEIDNHIRLPDGWYMWGDNNNERSVGNCPIQGFGSCILRRAIAMAQDKGLEFSIPLHDAGYIVCDTGDWNAVDAFHEVMRDAFAYYFEGKNKELALKVGLDCEVWGPDIEEGTVYTKKGRQVKCEKIHIDERSKKEYDQFSKYFTTPDSELL